MLDIDSRWWKYITPLKLQQLLSELPEDAVYLAPNRVGNLVVLDSDLNMTGVIDIAGEAIESYEDME